MNAISGKNYFDDNVVWYLRQTPADGEVNPEQEGPRVRALLMPFACRLENILQDAAADVKKDIRVISRPPENGDEGLEHKVAYFKELIELSYPFTRGRGEFEILTTLDIKSSLTSEEETLRYKRLASEVIENCSRSPGFTPDVEEGFRSVRITKGHNQGYWEIRNGILYVGRGRSFL
ncbi:hypothetical protein TWF730_004001 [Orbilia blumenaviensis]|uniref:Uncharacterized protein n=1 Tax=Orbilia blumenaviensis TaxID=1796055 RepID=A0AAV9U1R9_9PEZI